MRKFTFIAFGKEIVIEAESRSSAMERANREWLGKMPEIIEDPNGWWFGSGDRIRWCPGVVD